MPYLVRYEPKTSSKIGLVGEAPGDEEWRSALKAKDHIGTPFIGQVGQHMGSLIRRAGSKKHLFYITNTVHKQPPRNDYSKLSPEDLKFGQEQLVKDLTRWKAQGVNLIIACGGEALEATTGKKGIYRYRGTVLPCSIVPGLKVLPTIHPGSLRPDRSGKDGPKAEPILILDIKKALKESETDIITYPHRNIRVVRSLFEAEQILKDLSHSEGPFTCDIETNKSKKFPKSGKLMTAYGIGISKSEAYVFTRELLQNARFLKALAIFAYSDAKKIFHNALFDCLHNALYYHMVYRNIYFDTMLAQHDCYPNLAKFLKPNSLGFCGSIYTNEPYWKDKLDEAISNVLVGGKINWEKLYDYNGRDCCLTYEVYEALLTELTEWNVWDAFNLDMRLVPAVLFAQIKGILIDNEAVKVYADRNEQAITNLERIKNAVFGEDFNTRSDKQMKALIYDQWDMPKQYKKGKLTVEDKKLRRLITFPTPYKNHLRFFRKINKTYKNRDFYNIVTDPDNRVRTSQKIHGTYTGRWSSSKGITGSGTNEQNRKKDVRHFYRADDDRLMGQMDLSQAEARLVAALCLDLKWLAKFDKEDQHTAVAAFLYNIRPDQVTKKQRNKVAKRVAHASHYLLGYILLSEILECSSRQAKAHKKAYFKMRPSLNGWHDYIQTDIKKSRLIRTCFGRIIQFFGPHFGTMVTDATAAEPQSTSVSYLNTALADIYEEIPEFEFLLQGHDSILFQTPDDLHVHRRVIQRMKEITEREITITRRKTEPSVKLTIPAEFEMGYNWGNLIEVPNVYDITIDQMAKIRNQARINITR